jgi:hypothetical protein
MPMEQPTPHRTDHVRTWIDEQPKRLLAGLLLVDVALVLLHVVTDGGRGPMVSLDTDTGFGGLWGFGQALIAAGLVYAIFRTTKSAVYLVWAVTFVTVSLDDLLEIHENGGLRLFEAIALPEVAGLRGQDLGEILVWAILGIPLLIAIGVTARHADHRGRRDTVAFLILMGILVFFAAGLDALHMAGSDDTAAMWDVTPLGVLEDGGELITLSLILSSAVAASRARAGVQGEAQLHGDVSTAEQT